jgi:hypothetical protein
MSATAARFSLLTIAVVLLLLMAGLAQLFRLRFARGDVYPPYSSLRADPLGAKALHDGLAEAGLDTTRNFRDLERTRLSGEATCYILGLTWPQFAGTTEKEWKAALDHAERGGRLVVSFVPRAPVSPGENAKKRAEEKEAGKDEAADAKPEPAGKDELAPTEASPEKPESSKDEPPAKVHVVSAKERLGVGSARLARPEIEGWWAQVDPAFEAGEAQLPRLLRQHTALAFEPAPGAGWRTIYRLDEKPVVIERAFGRGSVVLLADAFPLSNEAMLSAREPELLAWLQGAATAAVFDESHLGVTENRGVATLARRYGLGDAALVLAAVALLFIWRSRSSLVPSQPPAAGPGMVGGGDGDGDELAGRDVASGFVNLLRRTVPVRGLFATCLQEYRRSHAWRRLGPARQGELDAALGTATAADPLGATRRAHEIIARKP